MTAIFRPIVYVFSFLWKQSAEIWSKAVESIRKMQKRIDFSQLFRKLVIFDLNKRPIIKFLIG